MAGQIYSLCPPEYNEETIRRIDEDPKCQVVLATIAFSNGINATSILDSISLGFSGTLDIMWQEKGRAGRAPGTLARGIVLVQQSTITLATKFLKSLSAPTLPKPQKAKGSRKKKTSERMTLAKANFITETQCHIAFLNQHYENPPFETAKLDCIAAQRPIPCALCLERSDRTLEFLAPASTPKLPPFTPVTAPSTSRSSSRKLKLTKKEREGASSLLKKFRNSLRSQEHQSGNFLEHPQTMFLPFSIQTILLDKLLSISSLASLKILVHPWRHRETHCAALYKVILEIQADVTDERNEARIARNATARQKRARKRKLDDLSDFSDEEVSEEDSSIESDSSLPENRLQMSNDPGKDY
ncbi:hypothetical protein B0H19DRAFT_1082445 [Mycena capillaripes]|nr:hypothetical protein B0H19DRAFT_1082445 [Mycena capillaripes]